MYPGRRTTSDTTRRLVHRFYDQFWNGRDYGAAERIVGRDAIIRGSLGTAAPGPRGLERYAHELTGAFSDLHIEVLEVIVDRDRAAARVAWTGTHSGEALGCPATGQQVRHECVALFRTAHGRIVEMTVHGDLAALRRQLAADGAARANRPH